MAQHTHLSYFVTVKRNNSNERECPSVDTHVHYWLMHFYIFNLKQLFKINWDSQLGDLDANSTEEDNKECIRIVMTRRRSQM